MNERRPPAKMESRDERITFRVTPTQAELLRAAARERGDELSRYIRACVFMGHSMNEAQRVAKVTGA